MRFTRTIAIATVTAAALLGTGGIAISAANAAPRVPAVVHSLNGPNQLELQFQGDTFTYNVRLRVTFVAPGVKVISGILRDNYEPIPINLVIHGVQFGKNVIISVLYPISGPDAGDQGLRTFAGQIDSSGILSGVWSETGPEAGNDTWDLVNPV